ncbi:MAG: hypothetical protein IKR23_00045 [Lachnospiraceae bacterium]|nr:hypothetical protein [Lachnospiraceae bacterium]
MSVFKRLKNNNKGLSVLELLLVMAITVLLLSMVLISYNLINRADVKKSARRLESAIKTARVTTMSKGTKAGTLDLVFDGGNMYAVIDGAGSRDLITGGGVTVYAVEKTDDYSYVPGPGEEFGGGKITFETNGIMRMSGVDDTGADNGTTHNIFSFKKGEKVFSVTVYKETGAVVVKEQQ